MSVYHRNTVHVRWCRFLRNRDIRETGFVQNLQTTSVRVKPKVSSYQYVLPETCPEAIAFAADVPMRFTPRLIISRASSYVSTPPAALIGSGDAFSSMMIIDGTVAPFGSPSVV